jgi:hypothetical protein
MPIDKGTQITIEFFQWLRYHPTKPRTLAEIAKDIEVPERFIYDLNAGRKKGKLPNPVINRIKAVYSNELSEFLSNTKNMEYSFKQTIININDMGGSFNQLINTTLLLLEKLGIDTKTLEKEVLELQQENLYSLTRIELIEKLNKKILKLIK